MARKTYKSPQVKARWNKKNYDRMAILIPKGQKDKFLEMADKEYGLSMNGYINLKVRTILGIPEERWHPLYKGE